MTASLGRADAFNDAVEYARVYVEKGYSASIGEHDGAWKVQIFIVKFYERNEHRTYLDKEFRFKNSGYVPIPKEKQKKPGRPRKVVKDETLKH